MSITSPLTRAERDARRRAADAAEHSSHLEGAATSSAFRSDVDEYVEGRIDTDEIRRRIRARYTVA